MQIRPISEIQEQQRIPQLGRIRVGSMEQKKSPYWILSGGRLDMLEILAGRYGGEPQEWEGSQSPDPYRLVTRTPVESPLEVILPPDALSEPRYERWDGPKMLRACDGVNMIGYPKTGGAPVEDTCKCTGLDNPPCKPKTHVRLMFPETPIGVWRLSTNSLNAMLEMQAAIDIIRLASSRGFPRAGLVLSHRKSGGNKIRVPVLTSTASWDALEAANGAIGVGPGEPRVEIEAGRTKPTETPVALPLGAEVIDVEALDDDDEDLL